MIVVTGLMRSGTSALAKMLHQGGVAMGATQLMPVFGRAHEWEDMALQSPLSTWLLSGIEPAKAERIEMLSEYISSRRTVHHAMCDRFNPGVWIDWGVKTPFVAPYLGELERAAKHANEPLTILLTERSFDETIESLKEQFSVLKEPHRKAFVEAAIRTQEKIQESLSKRRERRIQVRHLWDQPREVAEYLVGSLGVTRDLDLMSHGIGREFV